MKNQIKAMKNIEIEAGVALAKDINAPVQTVEVVKTIDHKNDPTTEKTWQGYMVKFHETSAGTAKVVPISAGRLLSIQDETGVQIFAESDEGMELVNLVFGIEDGNPVFAE